MFVIRQMKRLTFESTVAMVLLNHRTGDKTPISEVPRPGASLLDDLCFKLHRVRTKGFQIKVGDAWPTRMTMLQYMSIMSCIDFTVTVHS